MLVGIVVSLSFSYLTFRDSNFEALGAFCGMKARPDGLVRVTQSADERTRGLSAEGARVARRLLYLLALVWIAVGSVLYAIELVKVVGIHG